MTEKRFTLKSYDGITCDVFDKGIEIANVHRDDAKSLCNLLNTLHEENEQLRKDREDLFYRERDTKNDWRELYVENQIFRKFIELNDFDPDEIIRQGKGIE